MHIFLDPSLLAAGFQIMEEGVTVQFWHVIQGLGEKLHNLKQDTE